MAVEEVSAARAKRFNVLAPPNTMQCFGNVFSVFFFELNGKCDFFLVFLWNYM